jgi:molybdate transport system substrate-binding protein
MRRRSSCSVRTALGIAGLASLVVLSLACGSDASPVASAPGGLSGDLGVFAASSLTGVFIDLGTAFSAAHPGAHLTFNFASSSSLVTQIAQGAPADVFASADQKNMSKLVDGPGTTGDPAVFATNRMEIIVAPGNPLGLTSLADLARPGLVFVTAAPEVPVGAYTEKVFAKAGVTVAASSLEPNVKAIVGKVAIGEADAGIVFQTDVLAAGAAVTGIEIPAEFNVVASYPIAVTAAAKEPDLAAAFTAFVLSDAGQQILRRSGFGAP